MHGRVTQGILDKAWPGSEQTAFPLLQIHLLATGQRRTGYNVPPHGDLLGAGGQGLQSPLVTTDILLTVF